MYYVLNRFGARHPCRWVARWPRIEGVWFDEGRRITAAVPSPLEFPLLPLDPNSNAHGPELPEYLKGTIPLFRDDLLASLRRAGVDNLDTYTAVVVEPDGSKRYANYKAVNIIGAVAAADMAKSDATVHPGGAVLDVEFDHLVVDEKKARGALMFRLAEAISTIMVHQKVKDHLLKDGFTHLEFLDPGDCAL